MREEKNADRWETDKCAGIGDLSYSWNRIVVSFDSLIDLAIVSS